MVRPKFIVVTAIILLLLVPLLQNSEVVSLKIYFWEVSMSRIIFFPVLILIGFVIGLIVATTIALWKKRKGNTQQIS
jgi:uncharacterized integral membrane protein